MTEADNEIEAPQTPYPECTKWDIALDQEGGLALQRFLDWLLENKTRNEYGFIRVLDLHPQKLIYEYFEIDEKKLEQERRQMLDILREKNKMP